jgi:hypothetical protein
MNEDSEVVCRFCLEGTKTQENPLQDPCECKGSIQFVHKLCLMRWRLQNIERNGEVCLLCHTQYKIPLDLDLELIPEKQFLYILLDHPVVSNATLHYTWFVVRLFDERSHSFLSDYGFFQLLNHSLLAVLLVRRVKVNNWARYIQRWTEEYRWTIFLFHLVVYMAQLFGSPGLSLCVSNFLMQIYWKIHVQILAEINSEVLHLN